MADTRDPGDERTYPRFGEPEMQRRREALGALCAEAEVDDLLLYGADRSGGAVQWLTQWPVTREAAGLWSPSIDESPLFVNFANHLDNARRMADGFTVRWGGHSTVETVRDELRRRHGPGDFRLGVLGPFPASGIDLLADAGARPVHLDRAFGRLRHVKSHEELEWVRRGAELSDAAVGALAAGTRPGMAEGALGALVEGAYLAEGGTNHIHYFSTTQMAEPDSRVPSQWPSGRRIRKGDAIACEVSASWWGYPGQLLRTFAVGEPPTPLYRDLHAVASAAFDAIAGTVRAGATGADLAAAGRLVEEAGFATCDDLVHGYVGGYFPPIVPGSGRPPTHEDFVLEAGMTVVVQPNVVTTDGRAGVQTGELVLVTDSGYERLHAYPQGWGSIDA